MDEIREVRYLTDDRDELQRNELVITLGDNGDWYVAVVPEGKKTIGRGVRISTSGGASRMVPGLGQAIAAAFKSLADVKEAEQRGMQTKTRPATSPEGVVFRRGREASPIASIAERSFDKEPTANGTPGMRIFSPMIQPHKT